MWWWVVTRFRGYSPLVASPRAAARCFAHTHPTGVEDERNGADLSGIRTVEGAAPPQLGGVVDSSLQLLVSVARAAEVLSVSTKTIHRRLKSGELHGHRIGHLVRVNLTRFAAMPQAEDVRPSEEHQMPEKKEELLYGKLKYNHEYLTRIAGVRVSTGETDPEKARTSAARLHAEYETQVADGHKSSDLGVTALRRSQKASYLKFRPAPGTPRRLKRIPAELAQELDTAEALEVFALCFAILIRRESEPSQRRDAALSGTGLTFDELSEMYFDGTLTRKYGAEYVPPKKSVEDDRLRYKKHLKSVIGHLKIAAMQGDFVAATAERISASVRENHPQLRPATHRQIMQLFSRLMGLAVFPIRLLPRNDLPKGFIPKARSKRGFTYIYPAEDAKVMACKKVPLHHRLFLGVLAREGMRASELSNLKWSSIDLENGIVRLDDNKTGDARAWTLDAGVHEGLRRWRMMLSEQARKSEYVIIHRRSGRRIAHGQAAKQLRNALVNAEVKRQELFTSTEGTHRVRGHDLRATYITIGLANGLSEGTLTARTGHQSSAMLHAYRRTARTHQEASLGTLEPLHEAIPELASVREQAE